MDHWRTATCFRQRQAPVRGALVGVLLVSLALCASGLLLTTPAAFAAPVQGHGEVAAPLFRPRPPRTPTPPPTATVAPSPTATPTLVLTATATGTGRAGTHPEGQTGTGTAGAQTAAPPLGTWLWWGLGVLVLALLGLGGFLVLVTRRTARASQPPEFALRALQPTCARLNQLHQVLPGRHVAPPMAAEDTREPLLEEDYPWTPLPPPQKPLMWAPLSPPRWLIEAGLLKADSEKRPAADFLEPPARVPADQEARDQGGA